MAKLLPWVKMPSKWITDGGLRSLDWRRGAGANNVAALMTLAPLLHHADKDTGVVKLTYDQLQAATSLSRAKISAGLQVLEARGLIDRAPNERSTYQIRNFDPAAHWAKFPAVKLYRGPSIEFFDVLKLRSVVELDALKLWYCVAARRDNDVNMAKMTYDHITDTTGIPRERIRSAISLLAANMLVHVERIPSRHSEYGVANAYRLPQIDGSRHMGSIGRGMTDADFIALEDF